MRDVQQQLFSGGLSGLATTVSLQPFDLLKTRLQQGDGLTGVPKSGSSIVLRTTREVVSEHGLRGLWRGTVPSLIRNVPGVALYMTSLTQLRGFMATSSHFTSVQQHRTASGRNVNASVLPTLSMQGNLMAGATTRVAVGFLLNPFSVLKARFESNIYAYDSFCGALISIARQGPSELLRGFMASSLRDAPYAGLFVVFYEAIKKESTLLLPPSSAQESTLLHGVSAASAGAIVTLITHPFDVVKTKLQIRTEDRYGGFVRCVRTIWQQRGITGYFDGASLRLSRKVLSSAIGWAVYEGILIVFRPRWSSGSDG
ncbi:solute carrier family 25 member 38 [Crepidotus variabilis]|uniref:Mitochondrial glycine transporter n=1 Tax=Crepidotus variabilis TaxID=179855 RepID=A0A9P6EC97_9AGAR|nr:solute carrier family 25 member 38 [Crepidotus variabilis]